jgi:hypothetical protein
LRRRYRELIWIEGLDVSMDRGLSHLSFLSREDGHVRLVGRTEDVSTFRGRGMWRWRPTNLGDKSRRSRQLRVLKTEERKKERDKNDNHEVTYQTVRDSSTTRIVSIPPS